MPACEDRQYDCEDSEVILHLDSIDGVLECLTVYAPGSLGIEVSCKDLTLALASCGYVLAPRPKEEAPAGHARRRKEPDA